MTPPWTRLVLKVGAAALLYIWLQLGALFPHRMTLGNWAAGAAILTIVVDAPPWKQCC